MTDHEQALTQGLQQVLGSTLLTALMSAMTIPLVLTKLSYLIDNPWSVSQAGADMAGLILADSIIDRTSAHDPSPSSASRSALASSTLR